MKNVLPKNNAGEMFAGETFAVNKNVFVERIVLLFLWTVVVMGGVWFWFCLYGFQSWARTSLEGLSGIFVEGVVLFVIYLGEFFVGDALSDLETKPKRLESMHGASFILILPLAWAVLSLLLNGQGFFWFCGGVLVVALGMACIAADERRYQCSSILNWCRDGAFKYRPDLVEFSIPEGVTFIGNEAFLGCPNLVSVIIPEGVTSIGREAFKECPRLVSVKIPDSVVRIGVDAFKDCPSLRFDDTQRSNIQSVDGWIVRAENLSGDVVLSGFRGISDGNAAVFQNCKMTSVEISDTMIGIGTGAFNGILSVKRLTIPKSVRSIGQGVAYSLEEVNISDLNAWCTITFEFVEQSPMSYSGGLPSKRFLIRGSEIKCLNIPDTISHILPFSFHGQKGIQSLTIPDSVTSIGRDAFSDCSSLQSVVFSDNVKSIGKNAFRGCSNLMLVHLPKHLERIDDYAFARCPKLVITAFPKGVTIGWNAFTDSPNVLTIPQG